jgi:branched-chain amino acid transport system permease protein
MLGVSQDKVAAALQGIDINRISILAMVLACSLAAAAGGLIATIFSVTPTMGTFAITKGVATILLGGLGSIPGVVIGGFILGVSDSFLAVFLRSGIANAASFLIIVLFILFRPQGIFGHE